MNLIVFCNKPLIQHKEKNYLQELRKQVYNQVERELEQLVLHNTIIKYKINRNRCLI